MNFCADCNNVLFPKNKEGKLLYFCKNCPYKELATNPTVYTRTISGGVSTQKKSRNYNIILDPTLPIMKTLNCPKCGRNGPVYFQTSEESMALTFVCKQRDCVFQGHLEDFVSVDTA